MSRKTVQVGVALSDSSNAKMEIRIKPWTVWTSDGDSIEWQRVGINGQSKNRVKDLKISTPKSPGVWPFSGAKPGKGPQPVTGARTPVGVPYTLPYTIEITFYDEDGDERTATVDPDMVIET